MTDLNQAYSSLIDSSNFQDYHEEPIKINPPQQQLQSSQPQQKQTQPQLPTQLIAQPIAQPVFPPIASQPQFAPAQQRPPQPTVYSSSPSYIDKLFSAKKDIWKAIQVALIIIFALSVHFILDHYFKIYFASQDLSFERELMTRLLYPLGALFLLWNLKAFSRS